MNVKVPHGTINGNKEPLFLSVLGGKNNSQKVSY